MLKVVTAQQQQLTRAFWLQAEPDFAKHSSSSSTCQCRALLARAEVCGDSVLQVHLGNMKGLPAVPGHGK